MFGQQGEQAGLIQLGRIGFGASQLFACDRLGLFLRLRGLFLGGRFLFRRRRRAFGLFRFGAFLFCRRLFLGLLARFGGPLGKQRQRLFHRHFHGLIAFGDGGVDMAVAHIGPIAALEHFDGIAVAIIAQFLQRLRSSALETLGLLFRQQDDGVI